MFVSSHRPLRDEKSPKPTAVGLSQMGKNVRAAASMRLPFSRCGCKSCQACLYAEFPFVFIELSLVYSGTVRAQYLASA